MTQKLERNALVFFCQKFGYTRRLFMVCIEIYG